MHIQLDPVGGIAGDMFAAAVLDAWPELEPMLVADFKRAGLDAIATVARVDHTDQVLTGSRFTVHEAGDLDRHHRVAADHDRRSDEGVHHAAHADGRDHAPEHHLYRDIRVLLGACDLDPKVRARALDIFARLAAAESTVHGIPIHAVSFHEVGAYDSIADIVCAAWLIERLDAMWFCGPLPLGQGRAETAHGRLPIPAPATVELLRGMIVDQDVHRGERITPTGAAIIAHLAPSFEPLPGPMRLDRCGIGFGTSRLPRMSNILRLLALDAPGVSAKHEHIMVCGFDIDDQTGEDLALALDRLRDADGVLDVSSHATHGKKGRIAVHVQLLASIAKLESVLESCFRETTTLGVRWHVVNRTTLARASTTITVDGHSVRVKSVHRPGGTRTAKAEIDDLAPIADGHAQRERVRASVESVDDSGSER